MTRGRKLCSTYCIKPAFKVIPSFGTANTSVTHARPSTTQPNMKLYAFCSVLLATTFSALSVAKVLLEPLPLTIHAGDIHEISWSTDQSYVSIYAAHSLMSSLKERNAADKRLHRLLNSFLSVREMLLPLRGPQWKPSSKNGLKLPEAAATTGPCQMWH